MSAWERRCRPEPVEGVWLKWNVYKTQEMYNLTVDTAHTFFVGEGQWLVHNCGGSHVFWSGGESAKNAAKEWAMKNGSTTLDMTDEAKTLEILTADAPFELALPYWDDLSQKFAEKAAGDVHVFLKRPSITNPKSIWNRIEYPVLLVNEKVKNIIPHILD
jgi:hypothetical protein